ncbi:MAG: hypothetical protein AAGH15_05615 [Myxococcota bacterium]
MREWLRCAACALSLLGCGSDAASEPVLDGGAAAAWPATLSEAGLFAEGASGALAEGVRSYGVRHALWTDGVEKRRHLLLPPGASIDTSDADGWVFPEGTRVFKDFLVLGERVETRLLWKAGPTIEDCVFVSYLYRADGTDADPVPEGQADARGTAHDVPGTMDCSRCHLGGADFVLGLGSQQLDRATFDAWTAEGVLPAGTPFAEPPGDAREQRVLGYLHGNCGHCHNDVHPLGSRFGLRLALPVGVTSVAEAPALTTSIDQPAAHSGLAGTDLIVVPGAPEASQLYVRMGLRDSTAMPPVGTELVDDDALDDVEAWIRALE